MTDAHLQRAEEVIAELSKVLDNEDMEVCLHAITSLLAAYLVQFHTDEADDRAVMCSLTYLAANAARETRAVTGMLQ